MTAREMQAEFDTRLQLAIPSTEVELKPDSTTIFMYLNQAQDEFVKALYSGNNPEGVGFEQTQRRTDELRTLVLEESITTTAGTIKPNSYVANLPEEYLYTLGEEVTMTSTDFFGGTKVSRVGITECTADNYRARIDDPYSEHRYHYETAKPLRLFSGDEVELISDGNYSIGHYHLRYLKRPVRIMLEDNDCELPEHTHQTIVNLAVNLYLQSVSMMSRPAENQS